MRHQNITTGSKSTNEVIADFVLNLKNFDGLSFNERMTLSQVKIKCLVQGSSDTLSDEELNCAASALARSTAAWDLHA
jgi:hypothetical protein